MILSIAIIGKGLSMLKSQKHYLAYPPFLVGLLLMIGFFGRILLGGEKNSLISFFAANSFDPV